MAPHQESILSKEIHNYTRTLMVLIVTCILTSVGGIISFAVKAGGMEKDLINQSQRLSVHDKEISDLNTMSGAINGRLSTIEERTGNMNKTLDKIDDRLSGPRK